MDAARMRRSRTAALAALAIATLCVGAEALVYLHLRYGPWTIDWPLVAWLAKRCAGVASIAAATLAYRRAYATGNVALVWVATALVGLATALLLPLIHATLLFMAS